MEEKLASVTSSPVVFKMGKDVEKVTNANNVPKVSSKRFLILGLFCLFSMINSFQWIQYSIITNIIKEYYGVSDFAVNWTSVIYMVIYIPGIVPASWVLNKKGLRFCVIIGVLGTAIGSWIKCASIEPDRYWVTMLGQATVATSQLFILNLPPRIAAVWFTTGEASRATSTGVFGNQLGIALGFVIPPLLVDKTSLKTIADGLTLMFYSVALLTSLILILIVVFFEDKPSTPPSVAQANAQQVQSEQSYLKTIKSLLSNRNYILILITYGLNVGVFYAVSTDLNQLVTLRFPDSELDAGFMGLIMIIAGIFGSVICGFALDKTHKYKETTLIIYFFSMAGMVAFMGALRLSVIWPLYLVSGLLGFFMTGYLPIGFEFAAEVSYPNPEGTSAGLLNAAAQVVGLAFTFGATAIIELSGDIAANTMLSLALVVGTLLTYLIKADLRRQRASQGAAPLCHSISITPSELSNK